MDIKLNGKEAGMVKELADSQGMTADEVVEKIVKWFFEDCTNQN